MGEAGWIPLVDRTGKARGTKPLGEIVNHVVDEAKAELRLRNMAERLASLERRVAELEDRL